MKLLSQHIESLIFTSEKPIKLKEIKSILEETFETKFKNTDLENALGEIEKRYEGDSYAFEMVGIAEGYQFLTKGSYFNTVATFLKQTTRKRLSRAALETLSIIAYKQPVSRPELERIRGVSCDYAIHKLLEKEMVTILGRSEAPGRPLLYGTSEKFMDYFGLKTLNDMPKPKDFATPENSIGEAAPIEEDTPNPNAKPRLELPISDLDEVVDMIAAILPPGPKVEIEETEVEEEQPMPSGSPELELPVTDLEEVVDMIAAVLPEEAKVEEGQPTEIVGEANSSKEDIKEAVKVARGNAAPIIPQASATSTEQKIPQENNKSESSEEPTTPTIAQLFAEAIKIKSSGESDSSEIKNEISVSTVSIQQPVEENPQPQPSKEKEETEHPTIAQLFEEAIKSKSLEESNINETLPAEKKTENELDAAVDVISASIPIENIPSESVVLNQLIDRETTSSEEE